MEHEVTEKAMRDNIKYKHIPDGCKNRELEVEKLRWERWLID